MATNKLWKVRRRTTSLLRHLRLLRHVSAERTLITLYCIVNYAKRQLSF